MSEAALTLYQNACNVQAQKTEARRIRTRVRDARAGTTGAAARWPFELLQNVHDAGPRPGREQVKVAFRWDGATLLVEHDGVPFELQEVAALLSGGSSKEFDSEETTGRFGTGFMVTHALSCRIALSIIIKANDQLELAEVSLNREGEDEAILENIRASNQAIGSAMPLGSIDHLPTARLRYEVDRPDAVSAGFDSLRRTLPYLFASCPKLGEIVISAPNQEQTWTAAEGSLEAIEELQVSRRQLSVIETPGSGRPGLHVVSFTRLHDAHARLMTLVEVDGEQTHCLGLDPGFPRLFARFPVRDTGKTPIPFVLDAPFELPQERDRLLMSEADKSRIHEALGLLPDAVAYAMNARWIGAHRLSRVDVFPVAEGDSGQEATWWNEELGQTARALSELPLVHTARGLAPAISGEGGPVDFHADFVLPRFSMQDADGPSLDRLWPLVIEADDVDPPVPELAAEWNEIAAAWERLGVEPSFLGLAELVRKVRDEATCLDELHVKGEPLLWIARLLDLVIEWSVSHSALHAKLLEGLLPDQNSTLHDADELSRDDDVDEALKDLIERIGPRVRSRLLHKGLLETAARQGLRAAFSDIQVIVPRSLRESDLIGDAVTHLDKHAADGTRVNADVQSSLVNARGLLQYLWQSRGDGAADTARRLPLCVRSGVVTRCAKTSVLMGPVAEWPAEARPFAEAYPPQRVLDDLYAGSAEWTSLAPALLAWRLIVPEPLGEETPGDLKDDRLKAVTISEGDMAGIAVSGIKFSQINHLPSELISRASADRVNAKALLGLLLCHIARVDDRWRGSQDVVGKRAGQDAPCKLRGALWLGDLMYRAWLPAKGEDGKAISVTASAAALKPLLEPSWLAGNDAAIELLTSCFGFDPLELRIMATTTDPETRAKVIEQLAEIVQLAGSNPEAYAALAQELATKKRTEDEVARNQALGYAVQEVVEKYLAARGLNLELVDHGYDYDVSLPGGEPLLDGAHRLSIGSWMMEVKATTSGDVRMTPTQAQTASQESHRYILCVVDLRGLPDDQRQGPWTAGMVEPRARVFEKIGEEIEPTYDLVTEAKESTVGIRNEKSLRYAVPPSVWECGKPLKEWAESLVANASTPAPA